MVEGWGRVSLGVRNECFIRKIPIVCPINGKLARWIGLALMGNNVGILRIAMTECLSFSESIGRIGDHCLTGGSSYLNFYLS